MPALVDKMIAGEGDVVELLEDYPSFNLKKGQRGVVVASFKVPGEVYDLEIEDESGSFWGFAYSVNPAHLKKLGSGAGGPGGNDADRK